MKLLLHCAEVHLVRTNLRLDHYVCNVYVHVHVHAMRQPTGTVEARLKPQHRCLQRRYEQRNADRRVVKRAWWSNRFESYSSRLDNSINLKSSVV